MAGLQPGWVTPAPRGWRLLGLFWLVVLALLGGGAGALQWLGPPEPALPAAPPPAMPPLAAA
ncbi:hypothetical protein JYK14_28345, partial [Siccirubricoccus sp. KC 17139]